MPFPFPELHNNWFVLYTQFVLTPGSPPSPRQAAGPRGARLWAPPPRCQPRPVRVQLRPTTRARGGEGEDGPANTRRSCRCLRCTSSSATCYTAPATTPQSSAGLTKTAAASRCVQKISEIYFLAIIYDVTHVIIFYIWWPINIFQPFFALFWPFLPYFTWNFCNYAKFPHPTFPGHHRLCLAW